MFLSFVWNYSLVDETWKEIEGLEGRYYISDKGRVLSLCCNGYKLLKPFLCSNGYYYVDLRINNRDIKSRVHRLVANAFLTNIENKPIVHHKDRQKRNNNLRNLEFLTKEEHMRAHKEIEKRIYQ